MNGFGIFIILIVAVVFIVVSSSRWNWHPFLSLLTACIGVGLTAGLPAQKVLTEILFGFGSLLGSIGIVVVLGSIIGVFLERSGSINQLGDWMLDRFARQRPSLMLSLLGALLGIPVFCDSGFIVLVSLAKSLSVSSNIRLPIMTLSLASGLYASHTLVPPTPGPIAAAGNLGVSDSLGLVILVGCVVTIPVTLIAHKVADYLGKDLPFNQEVLKAIDPKESTNGRSKIASPLTLILLPLLLITGASLLKMFHAEGWLAESIYFIGHPVMALLMALLVAFMTIKTNENRTDWVQQGITQAGPILLLTGCGGAFGAVIKATSLTEVLSDIMVSSSASGVGFLLIAFVVAALLKTAQGSSTSAIVITSSLLSSFALAAGLDTPYELSLLVAVIGAGAMTVSHANDSYFWVIAQFSGFDLKTGYRGFTLISLTQGITALIVILLLYLIPF